MENYSELFSTVSLIITVIALLIAVWQTVLSIRSSKESSQLTKNIEKHEEKLNRIQESLSTKYLDQFPFYLNDIAKLLDRAKQRIFIIVDIPGYGIFSNPNGWLLFKQSIERKVNEGIEVSVILYSKEKRIKILKEQFHHKGNEFKEWINSSIMKDKVNKYLQRFGEGFKLSELTHESYIQISENAQLKILNEIFSSIDIFETDDFIPIYFWMIDDSEAIFSIPAFTEDATEHGFFTSDQSFIKALIQMRDRYK